MCGCMHLNEENEPEEEICFIHCVLQKSHVKKACLSSRYGIKRE